MLAFFHSSGKEVSEPELKEIGAVPLPPYIKKQLKDPSRYQTVYSKEEGSVAAPTAGLHFTEELLEKIKESGNETVFITLHVGTFTFKPIEADEIEKHIIQEEEYEISDYEAEVINRALKDGRKIVAVGTTVVRALESAFDGNCIRPGKRSTELFIYPGYEFKVVNALITNFHLPRTSLLALVYAFGGIKLMKEAYQTAVQERYRFYSFGDAMLIL
jgi:S-adenosylmethionine:tRNA ribosyltransferase-isomerase